MATDDVDGCNDDLEMIVEIESDYGIVNNGLYINKDEGLI